MDIIAEHGDKMKVYEKKDWYECRVDWVNGEPIVINTLSIDGVFVADYKKFFDNYLENVKRIAPSNAKFVDLGNDGGY